MIGCYQEAVGGEKGDLFFVILTIQNLSGPQEDHENDQLKPAKPDGHAAILLFLQER